MTENPALDGPQANITDEKNEAPEIMKVEDVEPEPPNHSDAEVNSIKRKVDIRVLVALSVMYIANQLDRGNVSFAYISGMEKELDYKGNRYTLAISIYFPFYILATPIATVLVRKLGPRIFLPAVTLCFGLVVIGFGLCKTWKDQVGLRAALGLLEGCYFPSASFVISMYYTRQELAKRIAIFFAVGLIFGGCGGLIAYGLQHMDGIAGKGGWRWIFIWEGILTIVIAILGYVWMVDFPEDAGQNFKFLTPSELEIVIDRARRDRGDAQVTPFELKSYLKHGLDWKLWLFAANFLASSVVTYSVQYFLPIILQTSLGFSNTYSLCLTAPVYVCAGIIAYGEGWMSDRLRLRGPILIFNGLMQVVGFVLVGWAHQPGVRYFGTYLGLAGTAGNSPLCVSHQANNVIGQWRRAFSSASIVGLGTIGGVVAPFGFNSADAPGYRPGLYMVFGAISVGDISVCITPVYMYKENRRQARRAVVIEGIPGFRYML